MCMIGLQRTLTLVNGRRFVSANSAASVGNSSAGSQVDLNLIPAGLVDRVETIAIGGAPIYGSDAIAGTVNIILKDNFDGLQISGLAGLNEDGDSSQYAIRGLAGTNFSERSEEHTSELQTLMRISYAVYGLNKKQKTDNNISE